MSVKPISQHTINALLERAAECEAMAATARIMDTAAALQRLAARFRSTARQRAGAPVHQPGEPAAEAGCYRELNVFGTPTDATICVKQGEPLPAAPRGFTWRLEQ